jgi:MFS family permease
MPYFVVIDVRLLTRRHETITQPYGCFNTLSPAKGVKNGGMGRSLSPLWSNRSFWLLWSGQTASIFGDRVTDIALPWLILLQTHSAADAAFVTAARYLPIIALGLITGLIADRLDRRFLMIASDLGRALGLAVIVALGIAHQSVPLWVLVVIVLILGVGQLLFQVAYRAWLPDVTSEALLADATAALEASDALSTLTGPALGGVLIQAVGPAAALGADAASYLISAATLAPLRAAAPSPADAGQSSEARSRAGWSEALEGARFILRSNEQRLLYAVSVTLFMSTASIGVLIALVAQVSLRLPAWQAGLIFAAAGAGGLIGSACAPRLMKRLGWQRSLVITFLVAGGGAIGFALVVLLGNPVSGFVVALLANLALDGAVSSSFIITGTTSTLLTPRELRGRVNAVSTMYSSAVRGLSLIAVGALTAAGSPLLAFLLLAGSFFCAAVASWLIRTAPAARL